MSWRRVPDAPAREVEAFVKDFRRKARFLVDESLGASVAEVLRGQGWNARYVRELSLEGAPTRKCSHVPGQKTGSSLHMTQTSSTIGASLHTETRAWSYFLAPRL